MPHALVNKQNSKTISIEVVTTAKYKTWLAKQPPAVQRWLKTTGFEGRKGATKLVPDTDGGVAFVLLVVGDKPDLWSFAALPKRLPKARYSYGRSLKKSLANHAAAGWALGSYKFTRYKSKEPKASPELVWPANANKRYVTGLADATTLGRDLITTPAEDMGPSELTKAARKMAGGFGARVSVIKGPELLKKNYPTIHTVGRASDDPPQLIDIRWGKTRHPKVTLVGKGVCFDTGGLDLKPTSGMLMMKKDMGGAATVLALASLIMQQKLPVRLRVLVPAVENNVAGNAYRPKDIITTRKGITVEVDNTDAEGRLVLCDALAEASREKPELLIDFATLTGAARVALGTELPALFCNDESLANDTLAAGLRETDPLWRLPLHKAYRKKLDSRVADIANVSSGRFGGAITAALFLNEFVAEGIPWMHIDTMAWNQENKPGRPYGGEPFGLRAIFSLLQSRYK